MSELHDNLAHETRRVPIPAGRFAGSIRPWLWAAQSAVAVLTYREALRLLIVARQLGW